MPTVPSRRLATVICALATGLGALAGAGCGGDAGAEPEEVQGVGEVLVGSVAPLAQCRDWNRGTEDEKLATIEDIRSQINLEDAPVETPPLSDEEAMEVFDNGCEAAYTDGFRLYKLYALAAAFAPLEREVPSAP